MRKVEQLLTNVPWNNNNNYRTPASKWEHFERTCMENLNIVLTMSLGPGSGGGARALRGFCRNFPGLQGDTTINWMGEWPKEAWTFIAKAFLGEHPKVRRRSRSNWHEEVTLDSLISSPVHPSTDP